MQPFVCLFALLCLKWPLSYDMKILFNTFGRASWPAVCPQASSHTLRPRCDRPVRRGGLLLSGRDQWRGWRAPCRCTRSRLRWVRLAALRVVLHMPGTKYILWQWKSTATHVVGKKKGFTFFARFKYRQVSVKLFFEDSAFFFFFFKLISSMILASGWAGEY